MVRKSDIFALPPPQNEIGLNKLVNSVFADMPHDQIGYCSLLDLQQFDVFACQVKL